MLINHMLAENKNGLWN